jgi:3-phenylpropionate/trans-cinnamate dioxygenase ferredoxin reductase subunit
MGVSKGLTETIIIERDEPPRKAAFCFKEGVLRAVETINWPAYHSLSRKALSAGQIITRNALEAADYGLKAMLKR